jgi:KDO2-lipid IV(A) lauroyltransferase
MGVGQGELSRKKHSTITICLTLCFIFGYYLVFGNPKSRRVGYNKYQVMAHEDTTTQTLGTAFVLAFSRSLSPLVGRPIAAAIALLVGNRFLSPTFNAISINQWVAHNGKLTSRELRQKIRQVYQNQARALFDFYHHLDHPEEMAKQIKLTTGFRTFMDECMSGKRKRGTLMLMPHLSGFNLGGLYLAHLGFKFLTLAIPNPNRGYLWQNELRNARGMEVVPMSMASMQLARKRLQAGGTVLTGADRPLGDTDKKPTFFGRAASLPVAYVKLALKTGARVVVVGFQNLRDHSCVVDVSPEVVFERNVNPEQELLRNAEKILKIIEKYIRMDPTQWMMFLPVWPDAKSEMPRI